MKKNLLDNVWYVLSKTWKYEKRVLLIIGLQTVIGVISPLAGVFLPALVVNGISTELDARIMAGIAVVMLCLMIGNTAAAYIENIYSTYLMNNKIGFLSALFRQKMKIDYAYVESPEGQNQYENAMMSILNDSSGISGMLSLMGPIFKNILGLLVNVVLIVKFNGWIVVVLVVTAAVHFFIASKIREKQDTLREPLADSNRKLNYLFNYVSGNTGAREIWIFGMHTWLANVIDQVTRLRLGTAEKNARYQFSLSISDSLMLALRDAFAYWITIQAVLAGKIEVWELVLYLGIITCISSLFTELTNQLASLGQRNLEIVTFREFMDRDCSDDGLECENGPLTIELKDVSFRFQEDGPYVLRHVNLTLHEKEKIALVGENGAGKSTLVKIICGLYKPTEGKVLVNGVDLETMKLSGYQKLLATAFQDTYLMPMTVGENIAFGDAQAHTEEIRNCLEMAGLEGEFLDENRALTKMLDPNGLVPSGGQKQKLVLARVAFKLLYRKAQVLILDEPTAAMDAIAEKAFYENYIQLAENKSCILISHRLKSTSVCDSILVMEKGSIIEQGTHESLMREGTRYKEMYQLQSSYYQ
ncbi:MAG: ABC transporter ATP-binding protein [Eubacteriales bacterium]|nr:ABC transporter ATP-binding protein [Eubacteriales bacterium]